MGEGILLPERACFLTEEIKTKLFGKIQAVMEADSISQGEVARRIGTARPNVNKLMRSKDGATIDLLLKIAESIGLKVDLRMTKQETPHRPEGKAAAASRKKTRT